MERRKFFFFGGLIGLLLLIFWLKSLPDGRLHLVFCDVGQGDAVYIKFPDGRDGLVDGGPDRSVLNCLGDHMAFWDREIELVALTHPQADHLNGLIEVFKRYRVDLFLAPAVGNKTAGYRELVKVVREKGVRVRNVYGGDKIKLKTQNSKLKATAQNSKLEVSLNILWPKREWVMGNSKLKSASSAGKAQNAKVNNVLGVASSSRDLNDFSLVLEIGFGEFEALLTGDLEGERLEEAVWLGSLLPNGARPQLGKTLKNNSSLAREKTARSSKILSKTGGNGLFKHSAQAAFASFIANNSLELLKVPHHGSAGIWDKKGRVEKLLREIKPALAVISVGANNHFGHPAKKTLKILKNLGAEILRTDKDGEIEVRTDGKIWQVRKGRF